jgi:hypothetical protein
LKRGEIWWADLGKYRPMQQTGQRPVIVANHLGGVHYCTEAEDCRVVWMQQSG